MPRPLLLPLPLPPVSAPTIAKIYTCGRYETTSGTNTTDCRHWTGFQMVPQECCCTAITSNHRYFYATLQGNRIENRSFYHVFLPVPSLSPSPVATHNTTRLRMIAGMVRVRALVGTAAIVGNKGCSCVFPPSSPRSG